MGGNQGYGGRGKAVVEAVEINIKPGTLKAFEDAAKKLGYPDIPSYLWGDYEKNQRSGHYTRQEVGCAQQTLKKVLTIYGLPMPDTHEKKWSYQQLDHKQVAAWLAEGKTIKECARLHKCGVWAINKFVADRKKEAGEAPVVIDESVCGPSWEWPSDHEIAMAKIEAEAISQYSIAYFFAHHGSQGVRGLRLAEEMESRNEKSKETLYSSS